MKKVARFFWVFLLALGLAGCYHQPRDTVSQVSTIDAILAGVYDGQVTGRQLLEYGDFGIGTFDRLDGEMVVLDGTIYQIKADGLVYQPSLATKTPFAAVVAFRADQRFDLEQELDFSALQRVLDNKLVNKNIFYAVKVRGRFASMKVRSVPAQEKPYPPLVEVARQQAVFRLHDVSGTLVGFRSPAYVKGVSVPGYHIHFISDDASSGGHVLNFTLIGGTAEIDDCNRFFLLLPEEEGGFGRADLDRDRSRELDEAEH